MVPICFQRGTLSTLQFEESFLKLLLVCCFCSASRLAFFSRSIKQLNGTVVIRTESAVGRAAIQFETKIAEETSAFARIIKHLIELIWRPSRASSRPLKVIRRCPAYRRWFWMKYSAIWASRRASSASRCVVDGERRSNGERRQETVWCFTLATTRWTDAGWKAMNWWRSRTRSNCKAWKCWRPTRPSATWRSIWASWREFIWWTPTRCSTVFRSTDFISTWQRSIRLSSSNWMVSNSTATPWSNWQS